jgi:hypothetical protein
MTEAELVELWEERAAIIEEGCQSDPFWKVKSADWRRNEAERLAYWDIKRRYGIERMPKQCWRVRRDAAG